MSFSAKHRRSVSSHAPALTQKHVLTHSWSVPTGGEPCCRTAGFWLGPGLPAPGCVCSQPGQVHPKVSRWGLFRSQFLCPANFLFLSFTSGWMSCTMSIFKCRLHFIHHNLVQTGDMSVHAVSHFRFRAFLGNHSLSSLSHLLAHFRLSCVSRGRNPAKSFRIFFDSF